ncbi:MAG: hypothetical protein ABJQ29_01465 [Luteolibacter sp.]
MKHISSTTKSSIIIAAITIAVAIAAAFVPLAEKEGGHSHGSDEEKHETEPAEEGSSHGEHSH